MTTAIVSLCHPRPALVCQLRDTSPEEAIAKLHACGVLATEGTEPNTVVLLGFNHEVRVLLEDLRNLGAAVHPHSRFVLGSRAALASRAFVD